MTGGRARRLAWSAFGVWLLFLVGSIALDLGTKRGPGYVESTDTLFVMVTAAFPVAAMLILARQPRNRIGWILMAIGLGWALPFASIGTFAYSRGLPGGAIFIALNEPTWAPPIVLMGTTLLLRFPDGQLLSPKWKYVEWAAGVALLLTMLSLVFAPGKLTESAYPNLDNPLGIQALRGTLDLVAAFILLIPITIVASAFSLVLRFRRSQGVERLQLKWLTAGGAVVAVLYLIAIIASIDFAWDTRETPTWVAYFQRAAIVSFVFIPVSITFAVLKYRLYDIDVVINKAVVYGALAMFITAVYVGIVVGIGTIIGQGDRPNLGLSILATAVVAMAFQPVRERVERFANRLVYGKRATPYDVLSHFASRMAGTYATDDLMPQMGRMLAEGTGAATAKVWLRVGRELRATSVWPQADGTGFERMELAGDELPAIPDADLAIPVRDRGELLGALSITKGRGEPVTPTEGKLLSDLASQAGLVLRNVRLIEEIRASRQRIVSAQDEERRRIERNIHDGAQQQLVALNVKLGLARTLAARDLNKTEELISQLQSETQDALENLRDLARGIYPPLLADKGLVAALEAQARKAPVPVSVQADVIGRYDREIEAAVYFCVLEAMQNTAKYANASRALIRLRAENGDLAFDVHDDGTGFDPETTRRGSGLTNMTDRIEALGGSLSVASRPGEGTVVGGRVPTNGERGSG
ncbi:MAG: GAF domain-containing sensor histidine kinase [Actinomycetota bacterium]|nr:GAF domain-containing sensor histidine kinase [Actinomycetota bacterium]